MIIGVPREVMNNESRVALTPAGTAMLEKAGHTVLVERNAGVGSGFTDEGYPHAAAQSARRVHRPYGAAVMTIRANNRSRGSTASCISVHTPQVLIGTAA